MKRSEVYVRLILSSPRLPAKRPPLRYNFGTIRAPYHLAAKYYNTHTARAGAATIVYHRDKMHLQDNSRVARYFVHFPY